MWISLLMIGPLLFGGLGLIARCVWLFLRRRDGRKVAIIPMAKVFSKDFFIHWIVLAVGLLIYVAALILPATKIPVPDAGQVVSGWVALLVGFPFWGLNLWLFFSPIILILLGIYHDFWLRVIATLVQIACAIVVDWASIPDPHSGAMEYPGSIAWQIAFWVVAIAYALPPNVPLFVANWRRRIDDYF